MAAAAQPAPKRLTVRRLLELHVRSLAGGKSGYKKADVALDQALAQLPKCSECGGVKVPAKEYTVNLGRKLGKMRVRIKDKLAAKHSMNTGQNARRFEVEEVEQP